MVFDADFESGNLESVRRRKKGEYDVFIRNDSNSSKALNWFYFRMRNSKDFVGRVKISIVNMTKENSLFLHGQKPSFWSSRQNQDLEDGQSGWSQD